MDSKLLSPLGIEIMDVDLRTADRGELDFIVDSFHEHGALVIRGQTMTPDDLVAFISLFGAPQAHKNEFNVPGYDMISVLSNRIVDGKPIGGHNDGVGWHTDLAFKEKPALCTMLYAIEVPPEGSDTLLADGMAAYAALPAEKRDAIDGLKVVNSFEHLVEARVYNTRKVTEEEKLMFPEVVHPLVRQHPVNGRRALWPTGASSKEVLDMPGQAGLDLVQEMVDFVTRDEFIYRHKWQVGDILLWDNRRSLHTGTLFDDTKYIRTMHRLWVEGDRPY